MRACLCLCVCVLATLATLAAGVDEEPIITTSPEPEEAAPRDKTTELRQDDRQEQEDSKLSKPSKQDDIKPSSQDDIKPSKQDDIKPAVESRLQKLQREVQERRIKRKSKTSSHDPPAEQDAGRKVQRRTSDDAQDKARREQARRRNQQEKLDLLRELEEENSLSDDDSDEFVEDNYSVEWQGGLVCPEAREVSLFAKQCRLDADCRSVGEQCCKDRTGRRRCTQGVAPPAPEIRHAPFLGVIARVCPGTADPLVEPWAITNCTSDADCWPRVCCRDAPHHSAYCRTPLPEWDKLPAQRIVAPLRLLMSYLQCTPPPPPVFDLFPKPCRNTLDCFPNLCCQERDQKVCRPPKRSLLALLASIGQNAGIGLRQQQSPPSK